MKVLNAEQYWGLTSNYWRTHIAESSGDAGSSSVVKDISHFLWTAKVYYRVHKSLPLGKFNPVHIKFLVCLRLNLILLFDLCLNFPSPVYPSDYRTRSLYALLFCSYMWYVPCPSTSLWFGSLNVDRVQSWSFYYYYYYYYYCFFFLLLLLVRSLNRSVLFATGGSTVVCLLFFFA
jgi:hypothetical protein